MPKIISSYMRGYFLCSQIYLRLLSASFKLEKCVAFRVWILHRYVGAVPTTALIILYVGVDGIKSVEAVGECDFLPTRDAFRLSGLDRSAHLPDICHVLSDELPATGKTVPFGGIGIDGYNE